MPEAPRQTVARRHPGVGMPHAAVAELTFPALTVEPISRMLALQFQFERSEWWPPERLAEEQYAQLALVLAHAFETTPYYRTLFTRAGVRRPAKVDAGFLRTLPITKRADIQTAGRGLVSQRHPKEHGPMTFARTSGSTGQPVDFGRDNLTNLMWLACSLREYLWHGRDFRGKIASIRQMKPGEADAPDGARTAQWGSSVASAFPTGPGVLLDVASSLDDQIAWLRREQPGQLISLPSNLVALAAHAQARGEPLPPIGEIRTFGEMLPADSREILRQAWRGKVTDMYTCEEAGYLALQCPEHDHFHVMAENVIIEIVDEAGQACEVGVPGRVLVTSLHNFGTPLIRYDIGDYAEFGPPCPCGRGLPVIRQVHGRRRNRVVLPDGRTGFPRLGERTFVTTPGLRIAQFKCVQKSLAAVELQLVCEPRPDAAQQAEIARVLTVSLGHPFAVSFSFPERILPGPNGKFETFVSEVS
jgi:phenylacetate-CoA ligase